MPSGSEGSPETRFEAPRFQLPVGKIAPGQSQPKRVPPKRRGTNPRLVQRIALGVATFAISLTLVAIVYRFGVSPVFGDVALENGTTAAVALLIGYFALPALQQRRLNPRTHLGVCLTVLAITPWTYQLGNQLETSGMDLATGFNFIFEVLLAVSLYRLAARATQRTPPSRPS